MGRYKMKIVRGRMSYAEALHYTTRSSDRSVRS
jgi:hypothetical protein